ncbi:MAG: NADH-quinone oxidoreductase subunit [Acidobacteriota bacterium]|nr:NADH-quinone oxidoreductase subunit [Acidobacteriota bacterium]
MFGLTMIIAALADYFPMLLFAVLFLMAVGAAISLVTQRNPLYSAISLVFVFLSLAGLYILLAAPFIAAVQVIVYAGAIMVLVIFVIMLLNVEETEQPGRARLRYLLPTAVVLAAVLFAEAAFIIFFVHGTGVDRANAAAPANTGLTANIGAGLFTTYLLPFEITSLLILMAIVGAMTLARRASVLRPTDVIVPGAQSLTRHTLASTQLSETTPVITHTTAEAERALGLSNAPHRRERG